jgi:hypothetical protein
LNYGSLYGLVLSKDGTLRLLEVWDQQPGAFGASDSWVRTLPKSESTWCCKFWMKPSKLLAMPDLILHFGHIPVYLVLSDLYHGGFFVKIKHCYRILEKNILIAFTFFFEEQHIYWFI